MDTMVPVQWSVVGRVVLCHILLPCSPGGRYFVLFISLVVQPVVHPVGLTVWALGLVHLTRPTRLLLPRGLVKSAHFPGLTFLFLGIRAGPLCLCGVPSGVK